MRSSKEPFFVKFIKSPGSSEYFSKALEVSEFGRLGELGELACDFCVVVSSMCHTISYLTCVHLEIKLFVRQGCFVCNKAC